MKLSEIHINPKNPRIIKDDRFKKLVKSIQEFPKMMELRPIVVDNDGMVLGGNMRLKVLQHLKYKEIPDKWVKRADELTEEEKQRFIVSDNVGFGEWNWDELANEWDAVKLEEWGLELPEDWVNPGALQAEEDDYQIPDEIHTDIVLGDLFEIGPHRLLCGDSTDSDQVARLMNGEKADLVFTDPPYGIELVGGTKTFGTVGGTNKVKSNNYSTIIGDKTTGTAKEFYQTCISLGIKNFIIWGGNYFTDFLPPKKGWIVWDKKGRQWEDNFSDFEMAWTSFDKIAKIFTHTWMGMVQSGEREKRVHPTQKPSKLISECIMFYMNEAKNIYDGFLGSGTTMVAAHQLNRKCYGMEIDPKYCEVILQRMIKLDPDVKILKNGELWNFLT